MIRHVYRLHSNYNILLNLQRKRLRHRTNESRIAFVACLYISIALKD